MPLPAHDSAADESRGEQSAQPASCLQPATAVWVRVEVWVGSGGRWAASACAQACAQVSRLSLAGALAASLAGAGALVPLGRLLVVPVVALVAPLAAVLILPAAAFARVSVTSRIPHPSRREARCSAAAVSLVCSLLAEHVALFVSA